MFNYRAKFHFNKGIIIFREKRLKRFLTSPGNIVGHFSVAYFFLDWDDGKDLFVRHSSIDMTGFRTLAEGDKVSFEVNESDRGPEAKNVKKA